jgi:hypothetical protein
MRPLARRIGLLEALVQSQEPGPLLVWRLPTESAAEACTRYGIDPDVSPTVYVWVGGQTARPDLALPPYPCWLAQTPTPMAELERRLRDDRA